MFDRVYRGSRVSKVLIKEVVADLPFLGRQHLQFSPAATEASYVTILIGRNGSGKSTILRDLTVAMRDRFFKLRRARRRDGRVVRFDIESDGLLHVIGPDGSERKFLRDPDLIKMGEMGPRKIIALSFTPFDKFPMGENVQRRERLDEEPARYVYIGFRSGPRVSPRALLLQSIDQLALAASSPTPDRRVVDVLTAIGYRPTLQINYQMNRLDNVLSSEQIDRPQIEALVADIQPLLRPGRGKNDLALTYSFDFEKAAASNFASNGTEYHTLRQLVRANVLRMTSATLERPNGDEVELLNLSSGELSLLCGFLGLAAHLEEGCVVLIDEPENSLHPEWQLSYVEMLDAVLRSRSGCHYVLATHSPLIVSGFADGGCTILRLDQEPVQVGDEAVANASPDATLMSAFNVLTPANSFLKQLVLEALTLIEQGRHGEARAQRIASFLASFYDDISEADPLRDLVRNICLSVLTK